MSKRLSIRHAKYISLLIQLFWPHEYQSFIHLPALYLGNRSGGVSQRFVLYYYFNWSESTLSKILLIYVLDVVFVVSSFEKITNYHISPTAISNHLNNKNRQYFKTTRCTFDVDAKYNSMPVQKVVWQAACWGVIAAAWPQDNNTRYSFTLKRNHIR